MNDAGLDRGLGEHGFDRFGEAFEPVDTRDQNVLDAALLEVGEDLHPELRALVGLKPHAEHVALAIDPDRQREIAGTPLDRAAVADLQHQRVQEHDRVDVIQRPRLPRPRVLHHRIGHPRDQVTADPNAVDLLQMRLDIPGRQAPAIEREDLVVEPLKAPLTLAHDLRLKRPRPIARRVDLNRPLLGQQRLRHRPVPRVPSTPGGLLMRLIAQVVCELDLHRPLHQSLRELAQQSAGPGDLLLSPSAREQLVDQPVRQKRLDLLSELAPRGPARGAQRQRVAALALRARCAPRRRYPDPRSHPTCLRLSST